MGGSNAALSGEQVSRLVGMIYDCVLAPERWHAAIEAIRAEFDFANGTLSSVAMPSGKHILGAVAGISPYWLSRMGEVSDALPDLWGGHHRIAQYPLEEPIVNSQACDPDHVAHNRYYREWALPQGITDAVVIGLERENTMIANVAFGRHGAAGPIDESVTHGLRLLAPHLRRAVNISRILEAKSIEAASFASVVEAHKAGVAMVDGRMHVLHANRVAQTMFAKGDPIATRNGRFTLSDHTAERALETAVAQCASDEVLLSHRSGTGVAFRRQDGTAWVVHVLPLKRRRSALDQSTQVVVALFIVKANRPIEQMPSAMLDMLYELTPAEAQVFALIVEGLTPAGAAARLGIAISTVKSHLNHVFQKTGTRRQADLARLALSLAVSL